MVVINKQKRDIKRFVVCFKDKNIDDLIFEFPSLKEVEQDQQTLTIVHSIDPNLNAVNVINMDCVLRIVMITSQNLQAP